MTETARPTSDRRRHRRVQLAAPLRGLVSETSVLAIDASAGGLRVAHESPLPAPGAFCRVELTSIYGPVKLDCQVVRTMQGKNLLETALSIISADRQSLERVRALFGKS